MNGPSVNTDISHSNITDSPPHALPEASLDLDPALSYNVTKEEFIYYQTNVHIEGYKDSYMISESTRGQSKNPNWMKERKVRLTASNFKDIVTRKKEDPSALITNLTSTKNFKSRHTGFGQAAEPTALAMYKRDMEKLYGVNVNIEDIGLVVNPAFSHLGASPDGFVTINTNPPTYGLAEVKTLSKYSHLTPAEAANMPDMFISLDDNGKIRLDRKDKRYYQIQGQLFICGMDWCDLIVWSPQGKPAYERIWKDHDLWKTMLVKLSSFYFDHILPHLTAKSNPLSLADYL